MKVIKNNRFILFMRDYRLPFLSTCCLLLIVILLLLLRFYEQTTLANALGSKSSTDNGFSSLLSKDKDAQLSKDDIGSEATDKKDSGVSTSQAPLTLNTNPQSGGTTGTNQPPATGGDIPAPPSGPFTAQISGFSLRGKSPPFICENQTGGSTGFGQYCINYNFGAAISTSNGPGLVQYKLAQGGINENEYPGSFQAPPGDALNPVSSEVRLRCDMPGPYFFHLELMLPNQQSSQIVPVDHNCGSTMLGP